MSSKANGGKGERIRLNLPGGVRITLPVEVARSVGEKPPMWYSDWIAFSEVEREILVALIDHGDMTKAALASELQRSATASLKDLLANLSNRRIILPSSDGYHLNLPPERRAEFRAFLVGLGHPQGPGETPGG